MSRADLTRIIVATIRASARRDCIVRLFVSRGPGGFSTNPYECPAAQLYIVITAPLDPPREVYERGVTLLTSKVPMKPGAFATCKSCNYLQNVLMKKEAVDAGVDFTVSIDEEGGLGEGSTENIGIITKNREFLVPRFDRVLRGTTLARLMELAAPLVAAGELARVAEADLTHEDAFAAAEMLIVGTGPDILPVRSFDGRAIGAGTPGPVFWRLLAVIREDIAKGPCSLPVFEGGAGGA